MAFFRRRRETVDSNPQAGLVVEIGGSKDFGPCSCCGENSRTVWGYIHRGYATEAAYFVQWTLGQVPRHGAHFDLIVGRWGDGTNETDRLAVSLEFRQTRRGPEFMVIDAAGRRAGGPELASRAVARDEVLGTPLARQAFDMVDAIWLQDERICEISGITTG